MPTVLEEKIVQLKNRLEYKKEAIVTITALKNEYVSLRGFAFDRGQSLLPYKVPVNETFKVLEGKAEVMLNGRNYDLEEGEQILMPKNQAHALFAKTKLKLALVSEQFP